jgi:hypothetical protein
MKEDDDSQVFPGTTQEDTQLGDLGYEQGTGKLGLSAAMSD